MESAAVGDSMLLHNVETVFMKVRITCAPRCGYDVSEHLILESLNHFDITLAYTASQRSAVHPNWSTNLFMKRHLIVRFFSKFVVTLFV